MKCAVPSFPTRLKLLKQTGPPKTLAAPNKIIYQTAKWTHTSVSNLDSSQSMNFNPTGFPPLSSILSPHLSQHHENFP